jgi:hypothetical protein
MEKLKVKIYVSGEIINYEKVLEFLNLLACGKSVKDSFQMIEIKNDKSFM